MRRRVRRIMQSVEGKKNMNTRAVHLFFTAIVAGLVFFGASFFGESSVARAQMPTQATYASPDEAMQALVTAAKAKDRTALANIFGPEHEQLLSGDEVEDSNELNEFAEGVGESAELHKISDTKYTVLVGKESYPLPIPIIQKEGKWIFDTKAGLDEILSRRIGENELFAINTCRAYAIAQWEYFTEGDWDNDGVAEYAQKFISSPGLHNGLYWETAEEEKPSPLGKLVAQAQAEGYGPKPRNPSVSNGVVQEALQKDMPAHPRAPFHGYYFKILKAQGMHAPGGKYNYVINGNMIAGYALITYPDKWGNSGVMTFIINQQGRVYEKNLGPDTAKLAAEITAYDPDQTWKLADAQP